MGDGTPAGYVSFEDPPYFYGPASWPGASLPFRDLTPPGEWGDGRVFGASGPVQGGSVNVQGGPWHGGVWFGEPESFIGFSTCDVQDVAGNQQVGRITVNGKEHGALWHEADPGTLLDLHPVGADRSRALATDGAWQGGYVTGIHSGYQTAALWKGSAGSYTDMHPLGSRVSHIEGMAQGSQVGWALRPTHDYDDHAILWHDTPESWRSMHPSFYPGKNSYMYATTGEMHVGRANAQAGVWFGDDPDSFHNLQQYLPGATGSTAYDIEVSGGLVYVVGDASYGWRARATVWIGTPRASEDEQEQPTGVTKRRP